VVFITNDDRSEAEWRRLIAKIIGPAGNPAQLQLLNVGHERLHSRSFHSDLRAVIGQLPAGVAGELESGRQFVLEQGNEETLRQKRPLLVALAAVASSFLVQWVILLALQSLDPDRALVMTLLLMLPALLFAALLVAGIFRAGARARLLARAGHHQASRRAWTLVLIVALLFLATPVLLAVQPIQQLTTLRRRANEVAAVGKLRLINVAEQLYDSMYADIGFSCRLQALGGERDSASPTSEAAQLIPPDLASGNSAGYAFAISNCMRTPVNGVSKYTGYQLTALPNVIGKTGDRGFCTDERGEILYDPNGGNKCTLPLR
jgi:type IV pilus assembly protein PilA